MKLFRIYVFFLALFLGLSSCAPAPKKELLIYCGITMIRPIREIADIIEVQEDIRIIIVKGGSGNLLRSIEINGVGDLYLPGSASYIESAIQKNLVVERNLVGYNRAALMVQKGNPLNISNDLENLANPAYYIILGNPESGSIGKETLRILEEKGISDSVLQNTRELTTDSKDLVTALIEKKADLLINWYAVSTWGDNADYIDILPIETELAPPKELILASLSTAKEPGLAQIFMDYAISQQGQAIFQKYGFGSMK